MNRLNVLAAIGGALAAAETVAVGQIIITSEFNTSSGWSPVLINTPAGAANVIGTGGNPGGFAELRAVLEQSMVGGAGFISSSPFFQLGTTLNAMVLGADYKWFSGQTLDFLPFLNQENRLYFPNTWIPLGTSTAWTSLAPVTFPLSTFSNSSGIPLNPFTLTRAGFLARITSPTPIFATARVGIDNLNLQVIPGPGAWVCLVLGLAGVRRRR